jgi:excisionase family DNA binding protein
VTTIAPELLTRREVADLFRVSSVTVLRMERAGKLAPVRVGRQVRYRETEVRRLMEVGE